MTSYPWPITLTAGGLALRPLRYLDGKEYDALVAENLSWNAIGQGTLPGTNQTIQNSPMPFAEMVWYFNREAKAGRSLPWVICLDDTASSATATCQSFTGRRKPTGPIIGQLTISGISYGSSSWAMAGYWISESYAGHGYTPLALAMATDYCFYERGLHRMEVAIRLDNVPSIRVVEKLGFERQAMFPRYMHVEGEWRDHYIYVLTPETAGEPLVPHALNLLK